MEKLVILGLRQKIFKIGQEHIIVPERKDVFPHQNTLMGYVKGTQELNKRVPVAKVGTI